MTEFTVNISMLFFFSIFLFLARFDIKHQSDDPIGAAAPLPQGKLPTYGDIARQWRKTREDMQKATPGRRVANGEIAKQKCFDEKSGALPFTSPYCVFASAQMLLFV